MPPTPPHFGFFFFWLRQTIEPNRARFARAAKLADRTVDRVEQVWRTPHSGPAATLLLLAKAVGMTPDQLEEKWKASGPVKVPPRKKGPVPKSDTVTLKLPRDVFDNLKREADKVGRTIPEYLRWSHDLTIITELDPEEAPAETASRLPATARRRRSRKVTAKS